LKKQQIFEFNSNIIISAPQALAIKEIKKMKMKMIHTSSTIFISEKD